MLLIFVIVVYSLRLVVIAISLSWPCCIMFLLCERYQSEQRDGALKVKSHHFSCTLEPTAKCVLTVSSGLKRLPIVGYQSLAEALPT